MKDDPESVPLEAIAERRLEGGCLCGAIRYRVRRDALAQGTCHCRTCRKVSSSTELPFATFDASAYELTKGQPKDFRSSATVVRSFCRECGSPLTYRQDAKPDKLDIMTGSLDDPNQLLPAFRVWTSHALAWAPLGDGLPAFATARPPTA